MVLVKKERLDKIREKIGSLEYLARGKRSVVYSLGNDRVVKVERDDTSAVKVCEKEYYFLEKLKKYKYFPKPFILDKKLRFVVMERVFGVELRKVSEPRVFLRVLELCRVLDVEGVNQTEMNNPYKHVLVDDGIVRMIDFERAVKSGKVHNVSQFVSYVMKRFNIRSEELIMLTKEYSKKLSDECFGNIVSFLELNMVH